MSNEPQRDYLSGPLAIIGSGLIGLSGAILVAFGKDNDSSILGVVILLVATVVLGLGLFRWLRG
jgi:hypothetical protein